MELDELLAIMAAPIYAVMRTEVNTHTLNQEEVLNELHEKAVQEAKKLWTVAYTKSYKG